MLTLKLAYRNLKGAGLRTWLNVVVLSMAYVLIIWHQGFFTGMLKQASRAMIDDEIAGGQYWHQLYDPYDPLSLDESHAPIPEALIPLIREKRAEPILIRQAAIYPEGRIQTVLIKGIDPEQRILNIPTEKLDTKGEGLPVLIGTRMAKSASLNIGDDIIIRWRDVNGTFDAVEGRIVEIMHTHVQGIDQGQLWLPLERLRDMTLMKDQATMIVVARDVSGQTDLASWEFKDHAFLLKDIHEMIKGKRIGAVILYAILLFLAMLAIFDTQVLAIFKRRKEIGTLMALGMTRLRVIALFTVEGAFHGILAIMVAALYGTPLILWTARYGFALPQATDSYGFAISNRLFPSYSVGLVLITILIVMITVTVVSFLPSRRISKLNPTDALKGKIS